MTLKGRNLLKMMDFTPEEILYLVDLSAELKEKKHQGIMHDSLVGKNIALIFEKTSTIARRGNATCRLSSPFGSDDATRCRKLSGVSP